MPFYEYQCEVCGADHEALQKISEPPLTVCPKCGQPALKKRISAAGFRLKGSGWYETDFKSGNKKNLHESGDGKAEKGDKADTKAEKKGSGDKKDAATKKAGTSSAAASSSASG